MDITKCGSQLSTALEQATVLFRQIQGTLMRLGRSVADKPQRLHQALQSRKNELRELLASSVDAIVVTNVDRSLVAANSKALDLLGVTETNIKQFTIDVFLSRYQIQQFDGQMLPFTKRETGRGRCEIRRLDGSLRVVEYSFVANFTPFRHVCRFRKIINTASMQDGRANRVTDRNPPR